MSGAGFAGTQQYAATSPTRNVLVNGDFETGTLDGWNVGGVCKVSTSTVHSGSYSAYVSDTNYGNWMQQNLTLPGDQDYRLEAWVHPLIVGNLGSWYYPYSGVNFDFLDRSSNVYTVRYAWSWYDAMGNYSQFVAFLLDFHDSQWNLLSRDVTQDARSYFTSVNFSELILYDIFWEYHFSGANPGAFYLDDLALYTYVHDVAVTNVTSSKTVVGQGFSAGINVTVVNQGDYPEAFNATAFANATIIGSENVTLPAGNSTIVTFTWNTTGFAYGNYTVSAYAWPVPAETDTANNNCTGGWVYVSIIGDITGGTPNLLDFVPDGKVDMKDIGVVARFFGQNVPPAPSNCDITGPTLGVPDGIIDMRDIGLAARHFGDHYP